MTISTKKISSYNTELQKSKQKDTKSTKDLFSDLMNLSSSAEITKSAKDKTEISGKKTEFDSSLSVSGKDNGTYLDKKTESVRESGRNTEKYSATDKVKKSDLNKSDKADVGSKGQTEPDETGEDVLKEAKKVISAMIDKLFGLIEQQFDVSMEDINAGLDELNIGAEGLFNEDSLKDFLLLLKDADNISLLVDEQLKGSISDIKDIVAGMAEDILAMLSENNIDCDSASLDSFLKKLFDMQLEDNTFAGDTDTAEVFLGDEAVRNIAANAKEIDGEKASTGKNLSENDTKSLQNTSQEVTNSLDNVDKNVGNDNNSELFDFSRESFNDRSDMAGDSLNVNFAQAVGQAFANQEVSLVSDIFEADGVDIVRQVIDDIKAHVTKDTTSLVVQLNPENLGKVTITVSEREGVMQARIIAENEAAKNAIESSLANLKEAFENQELKVDAIEVMVATHEFLGQEEGNFEENNPSGSQRSRQETTGIEDASDEELSEEQLLEAELMRMSGNRVSYSI